jgi:16S rRNA (adenine(1408)-N(1))-methyltransferase
VASFSRVHGKKSEPLGEADLALAGRYSGVEIDVGTGNGSYVLDAARATPERLFIGIDAVAENMQDNARRAGASVRKGGVANAVFVRGAAEQLPGPFAAMADRLTVLYPWGSLLKIVTLPDPAHLRALRAVCKSGAPFEFLINYSVFRDPSYRERLGLPDDVDTNDALPEIYRETGLRIDERELFLGDPPVRTRWGRQLVRGSNRETLLIAGTAV